MKTSYLFIALLLSASVSAQDYYWVGNSGNWSDLAHWATSSGGTEFHTELPGEDNDVYFDANSFTEPEQTVTIDLEEVFCQSLDASGVQNNPELEGVDFYDIIHVYGDIILPSEMDRDLKYIYLMGDESRDLLCGGKELCFLMKKYGDGAVQMLDSLVMPNLEMYGGEWYSNGNPVNIYDRINLYVGANQVLDFGNSNVYTNSWKINETVDLNMADATLYYGSPENILNSFESYENEYHRVVIDGLVNMSGDNNFEIFEALPGASLNLESGSVQTADQFIFEGTEEANIAISASETGEQATLLQNTGIVAGQYLVLSDSHATGGAIFNAIESIDLGNNTGWNINSAVPENYYWVNGSGSWSDLSHWATESGGDTYHESLPSAADNVYFDENSFIGGADVVDLGEELIVCRTLSVEQVPVGVSFTQSSGGIMNVYGDLLIQATDLDCDLFEIRMQSNSQAAIQTSGNLLGENAQVVLMGGGNYLLESDLFLHELEIESGDFTSNGFAIDASYKVGLTPGYTGVADFSESNIEAALFNQSVGTDQIIVADAEFTIRTVMNCANLEIFKLTIDGTQAGITYLHGGFSVGEFIVAPGSNVEFSAGDTIMLDEVSLEGTPGNPIGIQSSSPGSEAYFSKGDGEVVGYYLELTDNHAIGGATFIANESQVIDNVEGWNVLSDVSEIADETLIKSYPNPASGFISIECDAPAELSLFDQTGRVHNNWNMNSDRHQVDVSQLSQGVYWLEFTFKDGSRTSQKILINR